MHMFGKFSLLFPEPITVSLTGQIIKRDARICSCFSAEGVARMGWGRAEVGGGQAITGTVGVLLGYVGVIHQH